MASEELVENQGTSEPPTASSRMPRMLQPGPGLIRTASAVFWLMFAINVVNYLDRLVAAAVGPRLKAEFNFSDFQYGALGTGFLLVYIVAGIPLGVLADRASRAKVIALGVLVWSFFSATTAFARNAVELFITRIGVGVGEASYYPAGTALLSEYYPAKDRARVLSRWASGQIVGAVLAYGLSALFLKLLNPDIAWRALFLITALPGFALGVIMWFVADRPDLSREEHHSHQADTGAEAGHAHQHATVKFEGGFNGFLQQINKALSIKTVRIVIIIQAVYFVVTTPALFFLPLYLTNPKGPFHLDDSTQALVIGAVGVVGGLAGVLLGGNVSDWLGRRFEGARVLIGAFGSAIALPALVIALLTQSLPVFILCATIAIAALYLQVGPLTAAVQDATPPLLRSSAIAVTLLLSHLLGDIWATTGVGWISDQLGGRPGAALLVVGIPALLLGIVVSWIGSRLYAAEARERAQEAAD
ncbi:MAG TPA: MFS transporter [Ktedonobacterales bacterium]|jgi:MFS family permease